MGPVRADSRLPLEAADDPLAVGCLIGCKIMAFPSMPPIWGGLCNHYPLYGMHASVGMRLLIDEGTRPFED